VVTQSFYVAETTRQQERHSFGGVEVALCPWPSEASRRPQLAAGGIPRLFLVEADGHPPEILDCLEDWVRVPVSETDVRLRMKALSLRFRHHSTSAPTLDSDGVLRTFQGSVPLPPVEARLTEAMLHRFGAVVSRDDLSKAGWPHGAPGRNALDVHILRLRRRIAASDLVIHTVRRRGYLLDTGRTALVS
jgi:DNA-binding winged helix-turn-helix (wHTH) protein